MMSFTGGPKPIYFRLVIRVFNSPRTDEDKLKQELLVACESIHKTKHKTVPKTKVIAVFKEKTVCEKCGQPPFEVGRVQTHDNSRLCKKCAKIALRFITKQQGGL